MAEMVPSIAAVAVVSQAEMAGPVRVKRAEDALVQIALPLDDLLRARHGHVEGRRGREASPRVLIGRRRDLGRANAGGRRGFSAA